MSKCIGVFEPVGGGPRERVENSYVLAISASGEGL